MLLTIIISIYAVAASATLIICDAKVEPRGRTFFEELAVIATVILWPVGLPIFLYFSKQRKE
jgi:hypothetical protein